MDPNEVSASKSYALSGRVMLGAIVILFFVVIMMVCLHLYARWYLINARRRQIRRARNRRTHLIFYVDPNGAAAPSRGLDSALLKSLPVFTFDSGSNPDPIECAVCLSEFEDNETGRTLPKCRHSFHIECIDMWFHSHSTCPLCRSPVEPVPNDPTREDQLPEVVAGDSSSEGQAGGPSTSSFGGRRKPAELVGVTIEIPRRNGSFEDESVTESPLYRSPMSRMLSFRRILSRERRGNVSPSCGGGFVTESEMERGETQRTQGKIGSDSVA